MMTYRERAEKVLKRACQVYTDKDFEFRDKRSDKPGLGLSIEAGLRVAVNDERKRCAIMVADAGMQELAALMLREPNAVGTPS